MLDFKELPTTGDEFELMVRELLYKKGMKVFWSGKGPDGGKDLLCVEKLNSQFKDIEKTWLIQCKHNAHSGKSVGVTDLDDIVTTCAQHNATGYMLICSTYPSSKVVERLEGITKNDKIKIIADFWDSAIIERELSTPQNWAIAQRFLPKSSGDWMVYQTDNPNAWRINHRGYYFHLANRIGSSALIHYDSIDKRMDEMEKIVLPEDHILRLRAVHYDDKNGNYTWFIDYLCPDKSECAYYPYQLQYELGDGFIKDDGQCYSFDIQVYSYFRYSDHYDMDHYDYYQKYLHEYQFGFERPEQSFTRQIDNVNCIAEIDDDALINEQFDSLVAELEKYKFIRIMRSINVKLEEIHRFYKRFDLEEILDDLKYEVYSFFSAKIIFKCDDFNELKNLLNEIPQAVNYNFRLKKEFVFLPDSGYDDTVDNVYSLSFYINPVSIKNRCQTRKSFNNYFKEITEKIRKGNRKGTVPDTTL